jgi:cytochrome c oxidase subunit 3
MRSTRMIGSMTARPRIDVSELPSTVIGQRAPLWWGVVGMMAIESTMFALLAVTYFYLRGGASVWPPPGCQPPAKLATLNLAILLISVFPMWKTMRSAERHDLRGIRRWLITSTALGLVCLVIRAFEFGTMGFRWDAHVYGSIVWTILGMHALHLLASNGENVLFVVFLFKGPVQEKHLLDVYLNGLYWLFVVLAWIPMYAIVYLDPGIFKAAPGGM